MKKRKEKLCSDLISEGVNSPYILLGLAIIGPPFVTNPSVDKKPLRANSMSSIDFSMRANSEKPIRILSFFRLIMQIIYTRPHN